MILRIFFGRVLFTCRLAILTLALLPGVAVADFTAPVRVSNPQSITLTYSAVGVRLDGSVVVGWQQNSPGSSRVQARVRSATGELGVTEFVSPPSGSIEFNSVGVMVDDEGDAIIYWLWRLSSTDIRLQARTLSAADVLGSIQTVSPSGSVATNPTGDVDADGDALFVWYDQNTGRVAVRSRNRNGSLDAIERITATTAYRFAPPAVGLSTSGNAVIAWNRLNSDSTRTVQARVRSASGALGPILTVSPASVDVAPPKLGVDANGDAFVAWLALLAETRAAFKAGPSRREERRDRSSTSLRLMPKPTGPFPP